MVNLFHTVAIKYGFLGRESQQKLLYDVMILLENARTGIEGANGKNKFHQSFLSFIDRFCKLTSGNEGVHFHLKGNGDSWKEYGSGIYRKINITHDLLDRTENTDFIILASQSPETFQLHSLQICGAQSWGILFQLCGYADYMILYDEYNLIAKRSVHFIESLIKQLKHIWIEVETIRLKDEELKRLERDGLVKERNLIITERNLKRRVYEIQNLLEVSNELYSILNLKQLINSALLIIVGQIGCQKSFAILYDVNLRKYARQFTKGFSRTELSTLELAVDHPLINFFEKSNRPVIVDDLQDIDEMAEIVEFFRTHEVEVVAPITHSDRVQGIIGCGILLSDQKFSSNDMDVFNILVNMISISVSNAQTYEEVKNLSLTDAMTDLNNYRYFEDRLKEEINRGRRNKSPVSMIMLDIDHFKNYNDTLGHQAGDEALRSVGWILKNAVREEDIVNRYGGEEFCIILPGITKDVIPVLAERIRSKIEEYPFYKENVQPGGRLTVSLGGSSFSEDADNFEDLVYKADQAMYRAKTSGRNKLVIYNDDM